MIAHGAPAPATLLLGAASLSVLIASLSNLPACVMAFILTWGCMLIMRPANSARRLLAPNAFIGLMWLIVPFTAPQQMVFQSGLCLAQGFYLCILITLKANAIIAIFICFISPFSSTELATALQNLHVPQKLLLMIMLMDRNIVSLSREWRKLEESAKLRCFKPGANLRSYKTLAALLAILLLRAHDRSRRLYEAMLLAGFDGTLPFKRAWRPGLPDAIFLLLNALAAVVILIPVWISHNG